MVGFAAGIYGVLDFGLARVKDLVKGLTPEQLETIPPGSSNSIATLVLHIYGYEALNATILGLEVSKEAADELMINMPRAPLPAVKGETVASLLAKAEKGRDLLLKAVNQLSEEALLGEVERAPGRKMPIRFLLTFMVHHQAMHYGHMQVIKKALV